MVENCNFILKKIKLKMGDETQLMGVSHSELCIQKFFTKFKSPYRCFDKLDLDPQEKPSWTKIRNK